LVGSLMLIITVNLTAFAVVRERELGTLEQVMGIQRSDRQHAAAHAVAHLPEPVAILPRRPAEYVLEGRRTRRPVARDAGDGPRSARRSSA
jgi:hypothetical protein